MKIRVTFDITDEERSALNLALNGNFAPIDRAGLEGWINETIDENLGARAIKFEDAKADLIAKLKV